MSLPVRVRPDSADTADLALRIPAWTLGDRLRKARRLVGMSQAEFAVKLGEHAKTYASWELDTTAPRNPVAVAKRVEAITEVSAAWLLGLSDNDPEPQVIEEGSIRYPTDTCVVPLDSLRRRGIAHTEQDLPRTAAA